MQQPLRHKIDEQERLPVLFQLESEQQQDHKFDQNRRHKRRGELQQIPFGLQRRLRRLRHPIDRDRGLERPACQYVRQKRLAGGRDDQNAVCLWDAVIAEAVIIRGSGRVAGEFPPDRSAGCALGDAGVPAVRDRGAECGQQLGVKIGFIHGEVRVVLVFALCKQVEIIQF